MSKEKETIICRCEEVLRSEIEKAIDEGAVGVDGVKRFTRAGMGLCQGRSCRQLVARIISSKENKPMDEIVSFTYRPPFRPMKLDLLAEEGEKILKGSGQ